MTDRQFWSYWDRWRFDPSLAPGRAYGLALLIFLAAFVARLLLDQALPGRLPFITFFPAVLLATFFSGTASGTGVLVASAIIGALWISPTGTAPGAERLLGFFLFLLIGGIQVVLLHLIDQAVRRIRENERQIGVINRELKHRLKNVVTLADSVFRQSLKTGGSPDELRQIVSSRLQAIAAAQELMSIAAHDGSTVEALVDAVVAPLAPHPARLSVQGPQAVLSADATTTFALMLHELATNATKHGAWRGESGTVSITWRPVHDGGAPLYRLDWQEEGGGTVVPSTRQGFGSLLLRTGLPGAQVAHELQPRGLRCSIELPAAPPRREPEERPAGLATLLS